MPGPAGEPRTPQGHQPLQFPDDAARVGVSFLDAALNELGKK
jgi:hypothetical protein